MSAKQPHGPIPPHGPLEVDAARAAVRESYDRKMQEAHGIVRGTVPSPDPVPSANERPEEAVPADRMDSGGNRPRIRSAGG